MTGDNPPINNSSFQILRMDYIGNNTTITSVQFNTTDGTTHTSNLSNYNYTNPIVLDIDNKPIIWNSITSIDTISSDKYVAILEEYTNRSTLIGTPPYTPIQPPPIPTPVPTFDYDNSNGMLKNELVPYGITVNDSFKVLIGKISYINTPTTVGYPGIGLAGAYSLPYTIEDGFTIVNIMSDGAIIATYKNLTIYLKPGKSWTTVKSGVNTTGSYLANKYNTNSLDYNNITEMQWPVKNEQTYTLTNKGIFNKSVLSDPYSNK